MSKQAQMLKKRRSRLIIRTVVLVLLASAIIYTIASRQKNNVLEIGDMAPDFELLDLEGNKYKLSDYRGEGVFLNFWGTWCAPCKEEMPYMEKLYHEFEDKGANILTINLKGSNLQVEKFKEQYGLTFPIVLDKTESVKEVYNIKPIPTTFLINKDGKIEDIIIRGMSEDEIRSFLESIQTK